MSVSSPLTIMQYAYFLVVVISLAVAEQPSHSYLPPSPTSRNNGYSQGAQVVAARSSIQGNSANGFGRASPSEYRAAARAPSQGYDDSAAAFARNSNEGNSTVSYEADERGFKQQVSYEDSEELARSVGYNSNTNSRNYGNYKNGGQDARGY